MWAGTCYNLIKMENEFCSRLRFVQIAARRYANTPSVSVCMSVCLLCAETNVQLFTVFNKN